MSKLLGLIRGSPGKPLHPPLTDASIGAYTAGVAMLIAGAAGLQEEQMSHGALIAIAFGLILALPTALTGLLDWLEIPKGTPARTTATIHLFVMLATTVLFALTWLAQRPGYNHDEVRTLGLVLGCVAEGFLAVGGNIGGANVFVYGIRVLKREGTPVRDALNPLGVKSAETQSGAEGTDPRSSQADRIPPV
jgi:uncharacterized membrane protein